MAFGATRDDLVDVCTSVTFTSASNSTKRLFEPNGSVLKDEIGHRLHFLVRENEHNLGAVFNRGKLPRPHNWSKPRCIEWLEDPRHAIASDDDLDFLAIQLEILKGVVEEAMKEEAVGQDISEWDKRKFGGIRSCARLIHCVIDDAVKPLFLTRRVALSRQQMDALGTSSESPNLWVAVAELFNKSAFQPVSYKLPFHDFGHFFTASQTLNACPTFDVVSPDQCKSCFSRLMTSVKKVKSDWEKSGNGDDMAVVEEEHVESENSGMVSDDDVGGGISSVIETMPITDGARVSFLNTHHPATLYLWFAMDREGLIQSALAEIPECSQESSSQLGQSVADSESDSSGVTTGTTFRRRVVATMENMQTSFQTVSQGLTLQIQMMRSETVLARLQTRISAERRDRHMAYENGVERKVRFLQFPADHPGYAEFATIVAEDAKILARFDRKINELTDMISQMEREQSMTVATPATSNLSRRRRREHPQMLPRELHHDSDNSSDNNANDDAGGEMDADADRESRTRQRLA